MKIDIQLPCPSCGGKMYSVSYDASFKPKKRGQECDFERNSDDFKKTLCWA